MEVTAILWFQLYKLMTLDDNDKVSTHFGNDKVSMHFGNDKVSMHFDNDKVSILDNLWLLSHKPHQ